METPVFEFADGASPTAGASLSAGVSPFFGRFVYMIAALLVAISVHGASATNQRHFEFRYEVVVRGLPTSARQVDVWIPVPWNTDAQELRRTDIRSPVEGRILTESSYGNHVWYARFAPPEDGRFSAVLTFDVVRSEMRAIKNASLPKNITASVSSLFLKATRLVPLSERFTKLARAHTAGLDDTMRRGRALYDLVLDRMSYDKTTPGWGRGDALRACDVGKGNCSDYHSLFIALARSIGTPARFWIGFPLPADRGTSEVSGYHCWAEFWVPQRGWVPVDISEADKQPDRTDFFFGNLDENRVAFSLGRDLVLPPAQADGKAALRSPLNFFVYPYVEVDGTRWQDVDYRFVIKDLP